jgi:hypothetical protein
LFQTYLIRRILKFKFSVLPKKIMIGKIKTIEKNVKPIEDAVTAMGLF